MDYIIGYIKSTRPLCGLPFNKKGNSGELYNLIYKKYYLFKGEMPYAKPLLIKARKGRKEGQIIKNNFYTGEYLSQYNNKDKLLLAIILKKRFSKKDIKANS